MDDGAVSLNNSGNEDVILRSEPESINTDNETAYVREEEVPSVNTDSGAVLLREEKVPATPLREEQVFEYSDRLREGEVPTVPLREEQVLEYLEMFERVYVLPESLGGQQQPGVQSVVQHEWPSLT
ncbi:hypothetical protein V6N11_071553 [Hibiscus sabdariffa]|uniref:Uncharacterized protein n=1 Tax=Hibiscus sabdariffa TaxID=183260 RepID=A0ABR2U110_9ROSI